ncbi:hypothetical protein HID58_093260, partial [Brassica napus]
TQPIPPFPEDLCIVRDFSRGGPLFGVIFLPRGSVRRSRLIDFVSAHQLIMLWRLLFEDTSLSTVYAAGRSSGRGSLDAEEDGEPTVDDPIWMD